MISDAKLTNPGKADHFMKQYVALYIFCAVCRSKTDERSLRELVSNRTGALILSPSIGNLHGSYINPPNFRQHMYVSIAALLLSLSLT